MLRLAPALLLLGLALAIPLADAFAQERARQRSPAPPTARLSFVGLADKAQVPAKLTVRFAISGMEVVPAGQIARNGAYGMERDDAPDAQLPQQANVGAIIDPVRRNMVRPAMARQKPGFSLPEADRLRCHGGRAPAGRNPGSCRPGRSEQVLCAGPADDGQLDQAGGSGSAQISSS